MKRIGWLAFACVVLVATTGPAAWASPWAEVGDAQLRFDIEILAAAGVIDGITTHWPLPWASIITRLHDQSGLAERSDIVRAAAARVLAET